MESWYSQAIASLMELTNDQLVYPAGATDRWLLAVSPRRHSTNTNPPKKLKIVPKTKNKEKKLWQLLPFSTEP
ncbi:MAG: hypothetical protein EBE86_011745 [Hormoscilla sp. GUM202]|nr:hypothetical protein [Hormoscilla sp. GUM202]